MLRRSARLFVIEKSLSRQAFCSTRVRAPGGPALQPDNEHEETAGRSVETNSSLCTVNQTRPATSKYLKLAAAGVVGAGVTMVAAPFVLGVAGFTSVGVAQGSMAAWWMSVSGPIAKGSVFALSQSAGATGCISAGSSAGSSAVLGAGGGATGAGAYYRLVKRIGHKNQHLQLRNETKLSSNATSSKFAHKTTDKNDDNTI